jgi:acyl-CoA dehydrogenase
VTATDGEALAGGVVAEVSRIAAAVGGPMADEVDRLARFPSETFDALRASGALGALVPASYGGPGCSLSEVAASVTALGRHCASSAMILAMHHIQVACLARHGRTPLLEEHLAALVDRPELLASATTELGVGGDVRTSRCAVERDGDRFRLAKDAPVISYGNHADAVLVTARRTPDSPANDQVLVVCRPPGLRLEPMGAWDTLGFRGTCSPGFHLEAEGPTAAVLPDGYGTISARTMLPVAHVLWGAVWLGIASAAVERARRFVQGEARKQPGTTPPAARRLAEVSALLQQFADLVAGGARRFEVAADDPDELDSVGFAVAMNSLKVSASTLVVDVVYRVDSPFSLSRHLRDAHGAALMVNNDRILGNTAQLLLVHRGD